MGTRTPAFADCRDPVTHPDLLHEQHTANESGSAFCVDLSITLGVDVLHEHRESNGRKIANPLCQSYG